ncbi:MAG TPA: glucose 1-dehydrogenase [Methylomirabilota bacterium]|nr:glucose 1-dehydrogenase [Methylomirabilota bacterium]
MKTTMRAVAVVPGKREVRLLDHEMPSLSSDHHVKVRTLEVGVCGTDKEICTFVYGAPPQGYDYLVLGHESLGEVIEVGSQVSTLKPGDLVVPSVRRPCEHEHCIPCRAGLQDFCSTGDFTERGIKMRHGYMTEYFVEDANFLTSVPASLRDVAVLVEPLTVAEKGLAQVWKVQDRLPWASHGSARGKGLNAVVLGAGPVGILGAMTMVINGFKTYIYSRSRKPNAKADLVESFGVEYISSEDVTPHQLAEKVGNIDLVYEAVGTPRICFELLEALGTNGVYVFTGIPAPKAPIPVAASAIMRNLVLKNQAVVGTVNADAAAFSGAIRDLAIFKERWPEALKKLITGRYSIESYRDLLVGDKSGIKNVIALG